jgi:hypothetical protein
MILIKDNSRFVQKLFYSVLILVFLSPSVFSQNKGLSKPQDPAVLPKSKVAVVFQSLFRKPYPRQNL